MFSIDSLCLNNDYKLCSIIARYLYHTRTHSPVTYAMENKYNIMNFKCAHAKQSFENLFVLKNVDNESPKWLLLDPFIRVEKKNKFNLNILLFRTHIIGSFID